MIIGKDSWKFLVWAFIVLGVMCACGGIAIAFGGAGTFFGAGNILLGFIIVRHYYLKIKDK